MIAPPVKPTGGPIAISIVVGLGLAGACTQLLTLNMPFGESVVCGVKDSGKQKFLSIVTVQLTILFCGLLDFFFGLDRGPGGEVVRGG